MAKKKSKTARAGTTSKATRATSKRVVKKSAKKKSAGRKPAAAAKKSRPTAKKAAKSRSSKKTAAKRTVASRSAGRKAGSKKPAQRTSTKSQPAARPAKSTAGRRRMVAAPSTTPVPAKNPLTHRGTRTSRMQLLLEHQGVPGDAHGQADHLNGPAGGSNLGELVRATESRNESLQSISEESRGKRVENLLAASANARIRGHASGAGRRAQGRRDAAQRGEKRPSAGD